VAAALLDGAYGAALALDWMTAADWLLQDDDADVRQRTATLVSAWLAEPVRQWHRMRSRRRIRLTTAPP